MAYRPALGGVGVAQIAIRRRAASTLISPKQRGELVDAVHRLTDLRIYEQQHALEHVGGQRHGLGGHYDRFAQLVIDDAAGLRQRDAERAFEIAHDRFRIVLKRCRLQPPDVGALQCCQRLRRVRSMRSRD